MNDLLYKIEAELFTKTKKLNTAILRRDWFKKSELNKQIIQSTLFLPTESTYSERYYCIKNNIIERKICPVTGKPLNFNPVKNCYNKVVGIENAQFSVDLVKRGQKLSESKIKNNKNTRISLINKFYSKQYQLQPKDIVLKFVNDLLISTDYGRKTQFINERDKKEKSDILCSLLEYTHSPLLEPIPERINWSERFYLIIHNIQPPTMYNNPNKIGAYENFFIGYRCTEVNDKRDKLIDIEFPNSLKNQGFKILNDSFRNLKNTTFKLQCEKCGRIQEKELTNARWKDIYCPGCYGDLGFSKLEREISTFLTEHNIIFEQNKKGILGRKELDIFIPSKNIAIEFNGVLWHSFGITFPNNIHNEAKNKFSHNIKTDECLAQNIQLLHILDSEWNNKKDIVKSIILSKLGIFTQRIYARKCALQTLDQQTKSKFIDANHLQGDCNSTYNYGLFYNNELVSVMTFGNRKITGANSNMELLRFCNKLNIQIIGGASKLLSYFLAHNKITELVSYADRRYSNGNFYSKIGFSQDHISQPNYWYTNDSINLLHRMNFQKHKIALTEEDKIKTEAEIMYSRGYRRIYDCGNYVFKWRKA